MCGIERDEKNRTIEMCGISMESKHYLYRKIKHKWSKIWNAITQSRFFFIFCSLPVVKCVTHIAMLTVLHIHTHCCMVHIFTHLRGILITFFFSCSSFIVVFIWLQYIRSRDNCIIIQLLITQGRSCTCSQHISIVGFCLGVDFGQHWWHCYLAPWNSAHFRM